MRKDKILIVDDEANLCDFLTLLLSEDGYETRSVTSAKEALEALEEDTFRLMITDLRMPEIGGLDLVAECKARFPMLEVIVMTAYASLESAVEALRMGAADYVTKPLQVEEIRVVVQKALEGIALKSENRRLKAKLKAEGAAELKIMGNSEETRVMLELVRRVAPSDSTILITGDSGTGKELVAQYIHECSTRADSDFVTVNCAALPDTLLESELFGHRRGSFTGAIRDKEGLFKVASGGTLFLDEIGDMSPALQVKLLRALQEREVLPIGATKPVSIDVRVIAATNADLERKQKSGDFRPDLYYRLSVIPIHIKPLRERPDDILELSEYFLRRACKRNQLAPKSLSSETQRVFLAYEWPGNVRELENTIERIVILTDADTIEPVSLPAKLTGLQTESFQMPSGAAMQSLEEVEKNYMVHVLEETGWQKRRASEILGIDPSTIYRKLLRYGITPPR
ncbi:sigma-54-dependent Fis family transcriptional regulator [bacterium]|nr:MAG: sigma-54-dependent Fis family transcriptional regulator [bacterium]